MSVEHGGSNKYKKKKLQITFICTSCTLSNLHNTKMTISLEQKKIFQKEKRHSSVFQKAFQISGKYFSCHIHFKRL